MPAVFRYFVGQAMAQALRYKLQSLLIILAVGIGIANIIVLISMTDLGRRQTMGLINDFGARIIIITPYIELSGSPFSMLSPANTNGFLDPALLTALKDCPALDRSPQGGLSAMLILPGTSELLKKDAPADAENAVSDENAEAGGTSSSDPAGADTAAADTGAGDTDDSGSGEAAGDSGFANPWVEAAHFTTLAGVTPDFVKVGGTHVVAGRWITEEEEASGAHVVCLGSTPLKALLGPQHRSAEQENAASDTDSQGLANPELRRADVKVDPQLAIGREVLIKGERFKIVGVMVERGRVGFEDVDNRVFMPLTTLQRLAGYNVVQGIILRYREGMREDDAMQQVRATLATAIPKDQKLEETVSTFTIKQATALMDSTLSIFRAVLWGVGSIALLVAGIGIMNVMLIRVLQRRTEIGLRRACGATRRSVVAQFVTESTVQAMIGAALGVILGVIGVAVFCRYSDWNFYIAPLTVLIAIAFAAAVGVLFGAYPAWRAARVDPIQSLRSEM